jgi:serine/threonine protein kinase
MHETRERRLGGAPDFSTSSVDSLRHHLMVAGRSEPGYPRKLGRYHLLEPLSESSLGVLHLARLEGPNQFQRWAVVRRMHADLGERTALVEAFYDSARFSARIQHPNVATAYDVGEAGDPPWVAYEYVHGETVEDVLTRAIETRQVVPWDIACRIVSDAALGLEAIYELVRSDPRAGSLLQGPLAPSAFMVSYAGKTKILEGCLRTLDASALPYTAPEAAAAAADVRADVFGLGVILWELCAGRRLFAGATVEETRSMLAAHAVPSLKAFARCPTKLIEIVECALARDPGERFQTANALARAIQGVVVAKGLVLTDDVVARYLFGFFQDRFEQRQEMLTLAANVTEIFDRRDLNFGPPTPSSPDTVRDVERTRELRERSVSMSDDAPIVSEARPFPLVEMPTRPGAPLAGWTPPAPAVPLAISQEVPTTRRDPDRVQEAPTLPREALPPIPEPPTVPRLASAEIPPERAARPRLSEQLADEREKKAGLAWAMMGMALAASVVLVWRLTTIKHYGSTPAALPANTTASTVPPLAAVPLPPPTSTSLPVATTITTATSLPTVRPTDTSDPRSSARARAASAPRVSSPRPPAPPPPPAVAPPSPGPTPTQTGQLTVVCNPACDDVLDGDHSLGPSPVFKITVPAGAHRLTLKSDDPAAIKVVTVNVAPDDTTIVRQSLGD